MQTCNGAEEDRTPNLGIANAALSQLSYRPVPGTAVQPFFPRETSIVRHSAGAVQRYNTAADPRLSSVFARPCMSHRSLSEVPANTTSATSPSGCLAAGLSASLA